MKFLAAVLGSLAVLVTAVTAQSSLQIISQIPSCATNCILPVLVSLQCNITTIPGLASCICADMTAESNISTCVQRACNLTEQIRVVDLNRELCVGYPIPSRSAQLVAAMIALLCVTIPFVMLRFWSRVKVGMQFWWDDWTLLVATIFFIATVGVVIASSYRGLGKHIWDMEDADVTLLLKLFYVSELLYTMVVISTKISILIFYIRVFPQRWFKITTYSMIAFVGLHLIIYIFVVAFQCLPVQSIWDRDLTSRCLDSQEIIYSAAGFSIFQDIIILALPIPNVLKLKLSLGKRISVTVIFGLGAFACVTSIVRLKYLVGVGGSSDTPWDNAEVSIWSCIEIAIAIICACLPALRPLLASVMPKMFGAHDPSTDKSGNMATGAKKIEYKENTFSFGLDKRDDKAIAKLETPEYSRRSLSDVSEEDTELVIRSPAQGERSPY